MCEEGAVSPWSADNPTKRGGQNNNVNTHVIVEAACIGAISRIHKPKCGRPIGREVRSLEEEPLHVMFPVRAMGEGIFLHLHLDNERRTRALIEDTNEFSIPSIESRGDKHGSHVVIIAAAVTKLVRQKSRSGRAVRVIGGDGSGRIVGGRGNENKR